MTLDLSLLTIRVTVKAGMCESVGRHNLCLCYSACVCGCAQAHVFVGPCVCVFLHEGRTCVQLCVLVSMQAQMLFHIQHPGSSSPVCFCLRLVKQGLNFAFSCVQNPVSSPPPPQRAHCGWRGVPAPDGSAHNSPSLFKGASGFND